MAGRNYPISIRFVGENFSGNKGVPIYELGESLISIQRLVNRAYLLVAPSVSAGALPTAVRKNQKNIRNAETRQQFALQIAERSQGSDVYALSWFAHVAAAHAPLINAILAQIAGVAAAYVARKILEGRGEHPKVDPNASALYNEFANLANRIGRVGEIEEIWIKIASQRKPVIINTGFKEYIDELDGLEYPGERQIISGTVLTAHLSAHRSVDIITSSRRHVKVWVSWQAFRSILGALKKYDNPMFEFTGIPTMKMGDGPWEFREMEAEKVKTIPSHVRGALPAGSGRSKKTGAVSK